MNRIVAKVTTVTAKDSLHLVECHTQDNTQLFVLTLELPHSLTQGDTLSLHIKATAITLSLKPSTHLSFANELTTTVESIEKGEIVSMVTLRFEEQLLEVMVLRHICDTLAIQTGDTLYALLHASDISILQEAV